MILARDVQLQDYKYVRKRETPEERRRRVKNTTVLRQLSLIALGLMFFFIHLIFNWQTNQTAEELQGIQAKVTQLSNATYDLEAGLTDSENLRRVEYLATQEMGMVKPSSEQVILLKQ